MFLQCLFICACYGLLSSLIMSQIKCVKEMYNKSLQSIKERNSANIYRVKQFVWHQIVGISPEKCI
jgi:hypothetical protein